MIWQSCKYLVDKEENAKYFIALRDELESRNHRVELMMALLGMESERYERQRAYAMNCDSFLTPKGSQLRSDVWKHSNEFDDDFSVVVKQEETQYNCSVQGKKTGNYEVAIVSESDRYGTYEHTCTCGTVEKDGVPCVHVMALVKSKSLPFLSPTNVMPYYWTADRWREQFDLNGSLNTTPITREYLTVTYEPDESLRYMPDFVAKRKRGRPKGKARIKSGLEMALLSSKKKAKKKRPREEDLLGPDDVEFGFLVVGVNECDNGMMGEV